MARTTDPEPEEAEEQSNGKVPDLPDSHVAVSLKQADEVCRALHALAAPERTRKCLQADGRAQMPTHID